jgi:hypothetical protein
MTPHVAVAVAAADDLGDADLAVLIYSW